MLSPSCPSRAGGAARAVPPGAAPGWAPRALAAVGASSACAHTGPWGSCWRGKCSRPDVILFVLLARASPRDSCVKSAAPGGAGAGLREETPSLGFQAPGTAAARLKTHPCSYAHCVAGAAPLHGVPGAGGAGEGVRGGEEEPAGGFCIPAPAPSYLLVLVGRRSFSAPPHSAAKCTSSCAAPAEPPRLRDQCLQAASPGLLCLLPSLPHPAEPLPSSVPRVWRCGNVPNLPAAGLGLLHLTEP